jgi:hypothetical protein
MESKSANARHPMAANVGVCNFLLIHIFRTVHRLPTSPRLAITSIITAIILEDCK